MFLFFFDYGAKVYIFFLSTKNFQSYLVHSNTVNRVVPLNGFINLS